MHVCEHGIEVYYNYVCNYMYVCSYNAPMQYQHMHQVLARQGLAVLLSLCWPLFVLFPPVPILIPVLIFLHAICKVLWFNVTK